MLPARPPHWRRWDRLPSAQNVSAILALHLDRLVPPCRAPLPICRHQLPALGCCCGGSWGGAVNSLGCWLALGVCRAAAEESLHRPNVHGVQQRVRLVGSLLVHLLSELANVVVVLAAARSSSSSRALHPWLQSCTVAARRGCRLESRRLGR